MFLKFSRFFLTALMVALYPLAGSAATLKMPTDASQQDKPTTIKVLLTKLAREATVEVKGRFHVYNAKSNLLISSGKNKWDRLVFTKSGLKWGELFPGSFHMRIVPSDAEATLFLNGTPYRGCFEVYGIGGTVNIVNEIDIENLLKTTLSGKVESELDQEVLNAVVIVERTHLAFLAKKNTSASWQVTAEQLSYPTTCKSQAKIDATIDRTRHVLLTYNNQPFPATWGRHSAGRTVSYGSIFRKAAEMPAGVAELPSQSSKEETKWTASVPKQLLAETIGVDQIEQVELFQAEGSSKVYALKLSMPTGSQTLDFFQLQKAIGPQLMRSNDFTVKADRDNLVFTGYGEGVGVGLCLASAQILAEQQEDTRKILMIHFPGAELKRALYKDENLAAVWK